MLARSMMCTLTASCDINTAIISGSWMALYNFKEDVARLEVTVNEAFGVDMLYAKKNTK